jgi:hypothetical protein
VGYEAQLWEMADALRGSMDAAEYKHVVLGLIFLKYISDAFEERHAYLSGAVDDSQDEYFLPAGTRNRSDAVARLFEDPDEYRSQNIFWVPPESRWGHLKAQAKQPTIGQLVDDAMAGIERDTSPVGVRGMAGSKLSNLNDWQPFAIGRRVVLQSETVEETCKLHRSLDVVDADVLAEHCAGVGVLQLNRRASEADERGVRQRVAHVAREPVDEVVLAAVCLVGHHHDVAAHGEGRVPVAFFLREELVDSREDHPACCYREESSPSPLGSAA